MGGGGKVTMDITLSFYTQDIRVLGIRTPPTSLGLATPLSDRRYFSCFTVYIDLADFTKTVLNTTNL